MKLDVKLEVTNNLASKKGFRRDPAAFCQLSVAKDPSSNKYYIFVNSSKNPNGEKYRISNNIERIFCKFVHEGKATLILKEPPFTFAIQKADVNQLKAFLKLVYLAEKSGDITKELENIAETANKTKQTVNPGFKKPITTLTIGSSKEYERNFRPIITQTLLVHTQNGDLVLTNLTKLALTGCDLRKVHPKVLSELVRLEELDLSSNRLTGPVLNGFDLPRLITLNLSKNLIDHLPAKIRLPKLARLDLSSNKLRWIGRGFWRVFSSVSDLNLNSNLIEEIHPDFFHRHRMPSLIRLTAMGNQLKQIPFSVSSTRFEVLELNDNPLASMLPDSLAVRLERFGGQFPSLAELSSRRIIDSKLKYKPGDVPATLIEYLDMSARCHCGRACFQYHLKEIMPFEMSRVANSFAYVRMDHTSTNHLPLAVINCSLKCYNKFFRSRR